jgi:hypothetical protein
MPIRYHLDENIDVAVAMGLRQRGVDVSISREVSLLGANDQAQLTFAHADGRVLVTHDSDFLRMTAQGVSHSGIAYCPPRTYSIGEMIRRLIVIWRENEPQALVRQVKYL